MLLLGSAAEDLADVCFLATYVLLTVALLRLVRARSAGRDLPALLDALVISTGLGVVSWQFLMFPYARDPSLSLDQKLTSIVLPLADVLLLAVLVRLWSGGGRRPAAYWLLGLSVVSLLAADTAFGVVSLRGGFLPGGPIDAGYSLFALACGAAALHPSMAEVTVPDPPVASRRPRWRLVPLGAAAILAPAVQMLEWSRGRPIEVPVVAAGSIVMFLLIVARTHGLTREVTVQDERRRLLGRVLQAAEDERTRIAHDLHDGPVQQLAVLNYDVYRVRKRLNDLAGQVGGEGLMDDLQRTDEVLEGVEKGLGQETRVLRHLMSALRPPVLDNRGFSEALDEHAMRFEQETGIAVDVGLGLEVRLPPEVETILYRDHPGVAQQRGQARQGRAGDGDRRPARRRPGPTAGPRRRRRLRRRQLRPAAARGPLRAGRHARTGQPGWRDPGGRLHPWARHNHRGAAAGRAGGTRDGLKPIQDRKLRHVRPVRYDCVNRGLDDI